MFSLINVSSCFFSSSFAFIITDLTSRWHNITAVVDDLAVKVFHKSNDVSVLSFSASSFKSIRKTAESNPHYSSSFFAPFQTRFSVQSVPIATKVVSSNPVHGEVYSIQHYVIKFFSDSRQVGRFLRVLRFPPTIKLSSTI